MSTSEAFNSAGRCEGCSSNFSIFKRKKACNTCKQDFCQACLTRPQARSTSQSNERICNTCQILTQPTSTLDDILKCKTKHLRSYLNAKNISTQTCKEKRELAELIVKCQSRSSSTSANTTPSSTPHSNARTGSQPQQPQQTFNTTSESQQQRQNSRNFNDTLTNFMNNVQEFVNFNVNNAFGSPNSAMPMPMPNTRTSNNNGSQQQQQQQQNQRTFTNHNGTTTNQTTSTSSTTHAQQPQSSRAFTTSINDLFSIINDNVPPVVQQTFTNNRFTFNNVFNQPTTQSTTNTTQQQATTASSTSRAHNERRPSSSSSTTGSLLDEYEVIGEEATGQQHQQPTQPSAANPPPTASNNLKRRASISDLRNENDINSLTIKQMKEILASNFVEYKGCVERKDLIDRLRLLYKSHNLNRRKENELRTSTDGPDTASNVYLDLDRNPPHTQSTITDSTSDQQGNNSKPLEDDLCKICMDSLIDCVLLECGHMVSCTRCGKRLAECPICRQNVVRVVRVFKP